MNTLQIHYTRPSRLSDCCLAIDFLRSLISSGSQQLNSLKVSVSLLGLVPESERMSQDPEEVSGPQNMMKSGMLDRNRQLTHWVHF